MNTSLYLFLFFLVFFLLVFVIRSYLLWKNTGINPITFDKGEDAHSYIGRLFKFIFIFQFSALLLYAIKPGFYPFYLPFWYLEHSMLRMLGWLLLHSSIVWIFIAQMQMADSWRIGIDRQNKTKLITKGLYALSRNPIFLGILIADLGLFLVLPNALTLLNLVLVYVIIQIQVRLEERHLFEIHDEKYQNYQRQVRRWI